MDFSDLDDSAFSVGEESDGYVPEKKVKAAPKPKVAKPATKKLQTTLKPKPISKRPKPESDDEGSIGAESSGFSHTPPSSKKQKKAPPPKKSSGVPLAEVENDSMVIDTPPKPSGKSKTATETYQKLTQLEHIIKRPDTYIGSVEKTEQQMWVYNKETSLMEYRNVSFVPGFYKIFDEILVNAADNAQRKVNMTAMKINISRATGEISVENNGKGIPIVIHEKEKIYIPELLFGHLLAGSNFDDNEKKTVGGRNGYGAKLCNVFSTEFTLECQDSEHGKRYKQTWTNNMQTMHKAKITSNKTADFVRITFKPDYKRFGIPDGIDDDLEALLLRRVYDMAGTVRGIKVHLNGEVIKLGSFKAYCDLYAKAIGAERTAEEGVAANCTVEIDKDKGHPRWEVAFTVSDGNFQQVSFVNSIATTTGGTHVNYIADQITGSLLKALDKKKRGHSLKQSHLRNHIFIFINCFIDNPAFNSQTKEQLTTKVSQFGSRCALGDAFLKSIAKSDAIENIIDFAQKKADKMMSKSDGSKRARVSNAKLVEANLAGTRRGHECTLILTEGDSAKGLAVSGRAILDPDRIGVFPLRGKLLNVRDASIDQITKNQEIQNIKQFLGLKHKQTYTDTKSLRYGHLMVMADQDHDGSHIKGLLINFLQVQFPSLLQIPEFFREFITPIVKVWQGPDPKKPLRLKSFFTQPEYEEWKQSHKTELSRWRSKYFKGLGTSSNEDAQVYFTNLDEHLKEFQVMKPEEADLFDLVFSKKKADARKDWLGNFVPGTFLDHSTKAITYSDFVNKELVQFSMADNMRSIPSVLDGLKPGQRKVLFACFKRNLVKDKKVVELAGYVSETTAYHHGEASLQQTIIGLAQNYVGSNNINILEPSGNFGSRLAGGSDAASPRYIFTRLAPFARKIFSALDEPNLMYQYDDGKRIEPDVYSPIIPMVLVNGADGIGTGWSTTIPNYHPVDIVKNLKRRMGRLDEDDTEEKPFETMTPWFRGWKGSPEETEPGKYKFNGIAYQNDQNPNEFIVTELPIRMWTDDFKAKLEKLITGEGGTSAAWVKDYKEFNDHKTVHFEIMVDEKETPKILNEGILERFKMTKQIATTNLVAFNSDGKITRYNKVEDILEEYFTHRLAMYDDRKQHWLSVYNADYRKLKNQARFIEEIIDGKLVVSKKKKAVLVQELRDRDYEAFPPGKIEKAKSTEDELNNASDKEDGDDEASDAGARDYDYLLSMPIWALTAERLDRLKDAIARKKAEHDELLAKSEKDLWCADLDEFLVEWEAQLALDAEMQTKIRRMGRRASKKIGAGRTRKGKDDDEYEPDKKSKAKSKAVAKAAPRAAPKAAAKAKPMPLPKANSAQRFQDLFNDLSSDDDFSGLSRTNKVAAKAPSLSREVSMSQSQSMSLPPTQSQSQSQSQSQEPEAARPAKRAAASGAMAFDLSSSDGEDGSLGDIGLMVKGIGSTASSRLGSRQPSVGLSQRTVTKDETSEDELMPPPAFSATEGLVTEKKAKASAKPKPKPRAETKKPAVKSSVLSPAAKAYAQRKGVKGLKASIFEKDYDEEDDDPPSPVPKPAARGRPGRAAASKKPVIVDEDSTMMDQDDESDDPFEMEDD